MILECPGCKSRYDVSGRAPGTQARCPCGTRFEVPAAPETALKLACPSCGASVSSQAASCGYCAAPLAVQACPRCFGLIFSGSKFCGHCGARAAEPAQALERPNVRKCPRCAERPPLEALLVGGMTLDRCASCGGLFLDSVELDRAVQDRDQRAKVTSDLATLSGGSAEVGAPVTYLKCPDCDQLMARKNFAKRSGVIIDACVKHGIWFDHDELRQALEFVERGGLDLARKAEIDDLERQVRAKRQALTAQPTSSWEAQHMQPSWDVGGVIGTLMKLLR